MALSHNIRLALLTLAILAGLAMEHHGADRLAEVVEPVVVDAT